MTVNGEHLLLKLYKPVVTLNVLAVL